VFAPSQTGHYTHHLAVRRVKRARKSAMRLACPIRRR